jgi:aryl-alcohol dehydrogenase
VTGASKARAAVLRQAGGPFVLEDIDVAPPQANEVVVRLASVGVCRTDLHAMHYMPTPIVLGHEGAGHVEAVGGEVSRVSVGDPVVMTFRYCGTCRRCVAGEMSYCEIFNALNFTGRRPDGSSALSSATGPIGAHFLGQSSFATHAVVDQHSVVPTGPGVDLRPLGPFGCGFQTGAGTVLNALRPQVNRSLAVFGTGAVGMSAVIAAALAGCRPIVAVDIDQGRLATARRLGATETIESTTSDVPAQLQSLVPHGFDFAIDTTGLAPVASIAVDCLNTRGVCAIVGAGPSDQLVLDWRTVLNGRTVTGIIGGNSVPDVFLRQLVELHEEGRFPVSELVEYFPFSEINAAVEASNRGDVVKAVLTF